MNTNASMGVTPTERLLAEFCERSFLKLWSYPNPFKDDGHELCDLLAVFANHVFIFFDRENQYRDSEDVDPAVAWDRWKRSVIDRQVKTAHGAERYIKSGRPIFVDRKCEQSFPVRIDLDKIIVHKIVVAHGAKDACKAFSDSNIYGSLAISYSDDDADGFEHPFCVFIDRGNPVHVLDSHNLPIVLRELDTVHDFATYLDAKLDAINKFDTLTYCGEEDLLAHYLINFDRTSQEHFIGSREQEINSVMIGEGEWYDFEKSKVFHNTKAADQISYMWDELIQRTCRNYLAGTLGGNADLLRTPSAVHEMAKEPRFFRRVIAEKLFDSIKSFPDTADPISRKVTLIPSFHKGTAYVFLQLRVDAEMRAESDYRAKRVTILEIACGAAKNKFPHFTTIVGIAIDAPKFVRENSEDFILMHCGEWPAERRTAYETDNEDWNFFCSPTLNVHPYRATQFVSTRGRANVPSVKIRRNDLCPCGSARKFKKCCGK